MSSIIKSTTRIRSCAAAAVVAAALAMPGAAFAGSPTDDQYGSALTKITVGAQPGDPPGTGETGGSLPFTGLDVAAMAAIAAGLGLGGFAIRRRLSVSGENPAP